VNKTKDKMRVQRIFKMAIKSES